MHNIDSMDIIIIVGVILVAIALAVSILKGGGK